MKRFLHIILFLFSANAISQEIKNVTFSTTEEYVIVSYDLVNSPSSWSYDVRIEAEVVDDDGVTKAIVAKAVEGDLKKIKQGRNKTIRWTVFEDLDELNGELTITVRIIDSHYFGSKPTTTKQSSSELMGPKAALYSIVFPGWGDLLVSDGGDAQVTAVLFGGTYLLSGIYAWSTYSESQEYYKLYQEATSQDVMDSNYKLANDQYQVSKMWLGIAGVVLVTDVTYVLVRGLINKRNNKSNYSLIERTDLQFIYVDKGFGVGFKTRF